MNSVLPVSDETIVYEPVSPSAELTPAVATCVFYLLHVGVLPSATHVADLLDVSPEAITSILSHFDLSYK